MANLPLSLKKHLYPDSLWPELDSTQPGAALEAIAAHYPTELFGPRGETLTIGEYLVLLAHGLGASREEITATGFVPGHTVDTLTSELDEQTSRVHSEILAFADDPTHRLDGDTDGVETGFAIGAAVMHGNDWRKTGDPYIAHAAMVGNLAQAAARQMIAQQATAELCLTVGLWHDGAERFDTLSAKAEKDTGQRISRFAIPGAPVNAALLATYRSAGQFYRRIRGVSDMTVQTPADAIGAVTKRIYLGYEKEPHDRYISRFTIDQVSATVKLAGDGVHNLADPKPSGSDDVDEQKNRQITQKYRRDLALLDVVADDFDIALHLDNAGAVMQQTFDRYGEWLEQPSTVDCLQALGTFAVRLERLPYDPVALRELQKSRFPKVA